VTIPKTHRLLLLVGIATIFAFSGCGSAPLDPVETLRIGNYDVEVLTQGGVFNTGRNRVAVRALRGGQEVALTIGELSFMMPPMGTMRRMDTHTRLVPSGNHVEGDIPFEMGGGWEGTLEVSGPEGPLSARFRVQVR